jgi:hypothetical protein
MGNDNAKEKEFANIFKHNSNEPFDEKQYSVVKSVIRELQSQIVSLQKQINDLEIRQTKMADEMKLIMKDKTK